MLKIIKKLKNNLLWVGTAIVIIGVLYNITRYITAGVVPLFGFALMCIGGAVVLISPDL